MVLPNFEAKTGETISFFEYGHLFYSQIKKNIYYLKVYPAVEYDFVPNTVVAGTGSYVHFQWTGSDNNPGNNDGQGRARTDRSNAILMADSVSRL